jgi:hypothetical protein
MFLCFLIFYTNKSEKRLACVHNSSLQYVNFVLCRAFTGTVSIGAKGGGLSACPYKYGMGDKHVRR